MFRPHRVGSSGVSQGIGVLILDRRPISLLSPTDLRPNASRTRQKLIATTMLTKEFIRSEAALFDGMSSGEDDEDWTSVELILSDRRAAKRLVGTRFLLGNYMNAFVPY